MRLLLVGVLLAVLACCGGRAKPLDSPHPCPSACRCFLSEGLKRADCRQVPEWAELQSDAQDVRILGARRGPSALHLTHFEVFPKVLQLAVTNRSLVEIIPSGFHGLHSLQGLDLSGNLLSRFNFKVFLRMPALRRLVLQGNPIVLEPHTRLLSSRSLLSLDLSHCHITSIPPGSLDGMPKLTSLSLRGNPIHVTANQPLLPINTISELDLSACGIQSLPAKFLDNLQALKKLYLDGNKLTTVEKGVLPRGLHLLDVSSNQIHDVPTAVISSLRNLTRLELSDNPILCTCSLLGMQGWMSRQLVVTEKPVVCAEPSKFKGLPWTKVNELELCKDEESSSSSYSQSDSSDESSETETQESNESPQTAQTQSIEIPPTSYEVYTNENIIKNPQPALHLDHVLELKTLDFRSNNEINSVQGDEPYLNEVPGQHSDESSTEGEGLASLPSRESLESEEYPEKESGVLSRAFDEADSERSTDRAEQPYDDEATEKNAEVFMRNADTVAMGRSMPGEAAENAITVQDTTTPDSVAAEASTVDTTEDASLSTESVRVSNEVDDNSRIPDEPSADIGSHESLHDVPGNEVEKVTTESSSVESVERASTDASEGENNVENSQNGGHFSSASEQAEQDYSYSTSAEYSTEETERVSSLDENSTAVTLMHHSELAPVKVDSSVEETSLKATDNEIETTSSPTYDADSHQNGFVPEREELPVSTASSADVPTSVDLPPGNADGTESDRSEHARKLDFDDGNLPVPVDTVIPSEDHATTTPFTANVPVQEETIQSTNVKNVESINSPDDEKFTGSVSEEPVAAIPTLEETAVPNQSTTAVPTDNVVPSESVDTAGPPDGDADRPDDLADGKHSQNMAADNTESVPTESEEKSAITYVVLGCVIAAIVILILFALMRGKSDKQDGKAPVREDVGTEMKDMMNPLLEPNGETRRALLGSLELIREVEEGKSSCGDVEAPEAVSLLKPGSDGAEMVPNCPGVVPAGKVTGTPANGNVADVVVEPDPVKGPKEANGGPVANGKHKGIPTVPSKVKVKAGVIPAPVPRTPILVDRTANGTREHK